MPPHFGSFLPENGIVFEFTHDVISQEQKFIEESSGHWGLLIALRIPTHSVSINYRYQTKWGWSHRYLWVLSKNHQARDVTSPMAISSAVATMTAQNYGAGLQQRMNYRLLWRLGSCPLSSE